MTLTEFEASRRRCPASSASRAPAPRRSCASWSPTGRRSPPPATASPPAANTTSRSRRTARADPSRPHRPMTILAPDVVLNAGDQPPPANVSRSVRRGRRWSSRRTGARPRCGSAAAAWRRSPSTDSARSRAHPSQVVVGTPLALGASARWRLVFDGSLDGSSRSADLHVDAEEPPARTTQHAPPADARPRRAARPRPVRGRPHLPRRLDGPPRHARRRPRARRCADGSLPPAHPPRARPRPARRLQPARPGQLPAHQRLLRARHPLRRRLLRPRRHASR
jgi:hypothetical protein